MRISWARVSSCFFMTLFCWTRSPLSSVRSLTACNIWAMWLVMSVLSSLALLYSRSKCPARFFHFSASRCNSSLLLWPSARTSSSTTSFIFERSACALSTSARRRSFSASRKRAEFSPSARLRSAVSEIFRRLSAICRSSSSCVCSVRSRAVASTYWRCSCCCRTSCASHSCWSCARRCDAARKSSSALTARSSTAPRRVRERFNSPSFSARRSLRSATSTARRRLSEPSLSS
mmetsp:Transcript_100011/g.282348  ORF Transcript_100011/g.282348 Transcript_100011/m.282348 type:complete len:233 (-) Transcript_100011:3052-3750(-)